MITAPIKNTLGCPKRSPSRAPRNTVLPSTIRLTMTISAVSVSSIPKERAMLGTASVTGRLESCTSNCPAVIAISTWRRSGVSRIAL